MKTPCKYHVNIFPQSQEISHPDSCGRPRGWPHRSGQDLHNVSDPAEQKRFPDGGGGSPRFPRLFGVADVVLGYWRRVRSFSDHFPINYERFSCINRPFCPPPPSRPAARQHATVRENALRISVRLPNHDICGDSQCIFPYCSVLTRGWTGGRGRAEWLIYA